MPALFFYFSGHLGRKIDTYQLKYIIYGKHHSYFRQFQLTERKKVTIETGKLATMAHGSAVVRIDNTMLLATVVATSKPKEGQDFFPFLLITRKNLPAMEKFLAIFLEEKVNFQIMRF